MDQNLDNSLMDEEESRNDQDSNDELDIEDLMLEQDQDMEEEEEHDDIFNQYVHVQNGNNEMVAIPIYIPNQVEDLDNWLSGMESDGSEIIPAPPNRILPVTNNQRQRPIMEEYKFQPFRVYKFTRKNHFRGAKFPQPRSGHCVAASESHLYTLGGYNPRNTLFAVRRGEPLLFQELWSYEFATNRWRLLVSGDSHGNMPQELAYHSIALYRNKLISFGGTGYPFGDNCSNDCYTYSLHATPEVNYLPVTGDLPLAQYGQSVIIHENFLYTIGGTTGTEYNCDVNRLNLTTKQWERVYTTYPDYDDDDPRGRYRHQLACDGKYIYMLGGGAHQRVFDLEHLPAFNLRLNRWEYFDTQPDYKNHNNVLFPPPRKSFSCVHHTNEKGEVEVFIAGGLYGDYKIYYKDVWRLNLRYMQWTCVRTAVLPKPLYFHSAASTPEGCMYIFGGVEYFDRDMKRRNDIQKMWMRIPKLSEICWDAITHYNHYLDHISFSELQRVGIPKHFARRVHAQNTVR